MSAFTLEFAKLIIPYLIIAAIATAIIGLIRLLVGGKGKSNQEDDKQ